MRNVINTISVILVILSIFTLAVDVVWFIYGMWVDELSIVMLKLFVTAIVTLACSGYLADATND